MSRFRSSVSASLSASHCTTERAIEERANERTGEGRAKERKSAGHTPLSPPLRTPPVVHTLPRRRTLVCFLGGVDWGSGRRTGGWMDGRDRMIGCVDGRAGQRGSGAGGLSFWFTSILRLFDVFERPLRPFALGRGHELSNARSNARKNE
ncbi:hypothetical protein DFP72DRAFT_548168 [Ephemerocybe angulata]|uniref:Uncharacterized protein n=1 Tax=Ephemerocybe angulata TaxID=980116 RepID=A0A8H6HMB1_9AGAR|nr:hypothetical protein DFP72DRAFT_548168 [Tulosesus angulatus]